MNEKFGEQPLCVAAAGQLEKVIVRVALFGVYARLYPEYLYRKIGVSRGEAGLCRRRSFS
jgi:hypothetical protein